MALVLRAMTVKYHASCDYGNVSWTNVLCPFYRFLDKISAYRSVARQANLPGLQLHRTGNLSYLTLINSVPHVPY